MHSFFNSEGQTLLEMVIVVGVSVFIVGALVFATISSLRNSQFAKNQAQATKLAQEGIERVRSFRDRNNSISASAFGFDSWTDPNFWSKSISETYCPNSSCYFKLSGNDFKFLGPLTDMPSLAEDPNGDGKFKRAVILEDKTDYNLEKKIIVIVRWVDASGPHESRLTTILRKL